MLYRVLTVEFYKKAASLGQRLLILTAISLGARELSGYDRLATTTKAESGTSPASRGATVTQKDTKEAATPPSPNATEQAPANFGSITSAISLARTRRFSQKSDIHASRPAPKASPFANLAPLFLGGLLGRWGGNRGAGNERGYDAMQRAPAMVLKKLIMTLGIIVHYSGMTRLVMD